MSKAGVEVVGLRDKVKALQAAGADVEEVKDVMGEIAADAAKVLAAETPAKSGNLRNSARGNRAKGAATVTMGRASVPYAGAITYGWPKRNIRSSHAVDRTDTIMAPRIPEMLAKGFDDILTKRDLT